MSKSDTIDGAMNHRSFLYFGAIDKQLGENRSENEVEAVYASSSSYLAFVLTSG